MAATTIHLTLPAVLAFLVGTASCIALVVMLVGRLLERLHPKELAAVTLWDRILLAALVVFLALGPLYLIHLVTGSHCS